MPANRGNWLIAGLIGIGLAALIAVGPSQAVQEGTTCRKIFTLASTAANALGTGTSITSVSCHVCSVSFIPTAANGWALVYDSPGNMTHAQATTVAEPGSDTLLRSVHEYYGDHGRDAQFGLGAYVINGRLIVHYQD